MSALILFALAGLTLLLGAGGVLMILLPGFSIQGFRRHALIRKPLALTLLLASLAVAAWVGWQTPVLPLWPLAPILLSALGVALAFRLHPDAVFLAVDHPPVADHPLSLPLDDDAEIAVVTVEGVSRAYAIEHLIHHHIFNDRFGDRLVSVTYCAMCRSIIPFDVTELGPLSVAALWNANMVLADRNTRTFFQQASFESMTGPLHPTTLTMVPYQILPWKAVKTMAPMPQVARVQASDLRAFELPIPGLWRRILASEHTPSLGASRRDTRLKARTRVVGLAGQNAGPPRAWLKDEVVAQGRVQVGPDLTLYAADGVVVALRRPPELVDRSLSLGPDLLLRCEALGATWTLRGQCVEGGLPELLPVAISDEYWFSWKLFHPSSALIRLQGA